MQHRVLVAGKIGLPDARVRVRQVCLLATHVDTGNRRRAEKVEEGRVQRLLGRAVAPRDAAPGQPLSVQQPPNVEVVGRLPRSLKDRRCDIVQEAEGDEDGQQRADCPGHAGQAYLLGIGRPRRRVLGRTCGIHHSVPVRGLAQCLPRQRRLQSTIWQPSTQKAGRRGPARRVTRVATRARARERRGRRRRVRPDPAP